MAILPRDSSLTALFVFLVHVHFLALYVLATCILIINILALEPLQPLLVKLDLVRHQAGTEHIPIRLHLLP